MAKQFLALVEEAVRGTKPEVPVWLFLPVTGALEPSFEADDQPRAEFRGQDTSLGDASVVRRSSSWSYTLETAWYPDCPAISLLFKHLLGGKAERAEVTVASGAYKGAFYPEANPFGRGAEPLGDMAIGIVPNTDEAGTTRSRYFGGGRVKDCEIVFSGVEDVKLKFTIAGPGGYIGAEDVAVPAPSFPVLDPYVSSDVKCYVGEGIVRSGVAPEFTDIEPGAMPSFVPDEITVKITNGLEDSIVMNGVKGPSKTRRENKFSVEVSCPLDYEDPSAGFSTADLYKSLFEGPQKTSLLLDLVHAAIADGVDVPYQALLDLPLMGIKSDAPSRTADGKQPKVSLTLTSLTDEHKPLHLFTVDRLADI